MASKMILGIDASLTSTGLSLINGDTGEVVCYDRIPIKAKDFNSDEIKKIHYISNVILNICKEYNVTHIAIEDSYVGGSKGVGKTLARLYGGICVTLLNNGYNLIYTYVPSNWRKIVMGVGNKSKEGTHKWVCDNLVDLGEFHSSGKNKNDDIADSICIAYCLYKKLSKIK